MGLYRTNGIYCTQCEAEGFRRITYFPDRPDVLAPYTVTIIADKAANPLLLSNGNFLGGAGYGEGRHFAAWFDPHPEAELSVRAGRRRSRRGRRHVHHHVRPRGRAEDLCRARQGAARRLRRWTR